MTLEECSKEELIYIIHQLERGNLFHNKDYEFDILMCRKEKSMSDEMNFSALASASLQRHIDLIKPYEGQPLTNVPGDVLQNGGAALKEYERHWKKESQERKKQERIERRINEILDVQNY